MDFTRILGHIVTYPVDPTTILNELPLSPEQVNGIIKVVFIGRRRPTLQTISNLRFFLVRRRKVLAALLWLIRYNPLCGKVQINYEVLARLPEEGVLEELFQQASFSNNVGAEDGLHSRYDASDPEDDDDDIDWEQSECEMDVEEISNTNEIRIEDHGTKHFKLRLKAYV